MATIEKWAEDAAEQICVESFQSQFPHFNKPYYAEVIARHYAAREREVQELVKVLGWLDGRGGLGLDAHEYVRKALAPFTAEKRP